MLEVCPFLKVSGVARGAHAQSLGAARGGASVGGCGGCDVG